MNLGEGNFNAPSILWMIPQYVVMALGEVTFSVTGMQFSYSEAPDNMKSAVQALWQLNVAFGNLIDVVIIGVKFFDSQVNTMSFSDDISSFIQFHSILSNFI